MRYKEKKREKNTFPLWNNVHFANTESVDDYQSAI